MGHTLNFLTFDADKYSKQMIQEVCDDWANRNRDHWESNTDSGLPFPVHFQKEIFDDEDSAASYLSSTMGNYQECAVRYYKYPEAKPTKAMEEIQRRIQEISDKKRTLSEPHYKGVKQATVKCKHCGAVLPTSYCGKTYHNYCPVCRNDLRPQSVMDKEAEYGKKIQELKSRFIEEEKKSRNKANAKLYWMVCCEVHC